LCTLARELLDAASLLLGRFSSPTNVQSLQLANHTQLPHHYIQYAL